MGGVIEDSIIIVTSQVFVFRQFYNFQSFNEFLNVPVNVSEL